MERPRKRAKVAQNNPAEPNVSAQCDETAPSKDLISTLPTEILDKIFKNLLPPQLPFAIRALTVRHVGGTRTILNLVRLMSVSRKFNNSATDLFWKNASVEVVLRHGDEYFANLMFPKLQAFGLDCALIEGRYSSIGVWNNINQQQLAAYLCKARTVQLEIQSKSLWGSQRSLNTRSNGDPDFQMQAQYFLSTLRAAGGLTKLVVIIKTDSEYMARVRSEKNSKRLRWHLDAMELFKFCGVQLEVRAANGRGEEVQIGEASLISYIQELQTLAQEAEVSRPAPKKRKRYTKSKVEKPAAVKVEIEEDP